MTNTLIDGMKNAKLKKLVNIMTLSAFLLIMGVWTASARDSQESLEWQQDKVRITGTVVDQNGEPVIGANVIEKGVTANGTVTDADGKFFLQVSRPNATLTFSYIGFITQEVVASGDVLDVMMMDDLQSLEEVVVIGYGSVRKQNLTSSISKIDDKSIKDRPLVSIGEAFQGQLAGVRTQTSSGVPGAEAIIRIRGVNTINGDSNPLYVIDGVPRDNMSDINPSDVASIQVLKDAAATSIYGARGGNGVILIETKQGAGKTTVSLDSYYGWQDPEKALNVMNKKQWITYNAWARNVSWLEEGGSMSDPMSARPATQQIPDSWLSGPDVDWQEAIFQKGAIQNYQLSVSNSTDNSTLYLSGGFFSQDGVIYNTYYNRFNFRMNGSLNIGKRVKVGMNLAPSFSDRDDRDTEGKELVVHHAISQPPIVGLDKNTRDWGYVQGLATNYPNSIQRLKYTTDHTKTKRLQASVWGEVDIVEGLKFRSQYSYGYDAVYYEYFRPGNIGYGTYVTDGNSNSDTYTNWILQNTLTYEKLSGDHNLNLMIGQSAEDNFRYRIVTGATGWTYETLETLNLASTPTRAETSHTEYRTASFFGRAMYNFREKYLLTASLRYDGSSRFGPNRKWGWFPSFSAGWKINEEAFLKDSDFLSLLKLRASWGMSGNDRIGNYDYMALLGNAKTSWNNVLVNGMAPSNIENPNLQWEATKTTDLGLDLSLFNNRVQATFDYYVNTTDHLLFNVTIPYTTGFSSYRTNLGSIQNKGWDMDLTTHNLDGVFKWTTSLNLSANKNKVLDMGELTQLVSTNFDAEFITKTGSPISNFRMYRTDGILTEADFEADMKTPKPGVTIMSGQRPGNVRLVDQNNDGLINSEDMVIYGNPLPDLLYGFMNRFSWKNFDLNILLQGQFGGDVMFLMARQVDSGTRGINIFSRWVRGYKPDYAALYGGRGNPIPDYYKDVDTSWDGKTPNPTWGSNPNNTDLRVYDATFLRIKNIQLAYTLPRQALNRIKLKDIRVYMSIDNVKTFDNYPGATPETNSGGNNTTQQGVDYSTYPLSRKYTFGLNITF
ncbi:MAG: TonB-dependent receptor [Dysgonamonadaceae bacterium]|jgi:TonB-linked SusC/RagA family outer membrane protein|nr:TonB-dependent receptor [Dysgonamonadaceae bacterium]